MRRKDREITDTALMDDILRRALVVRLAMVIDGQPYIVPFCFGYEPRVLYFHSAHTGAKMQVIRRGDRVCFEADVDVEVSGADTACGWGMRYRSVVGWGRASVIEDDVGRTAALNAIMRKYAGRDFEFNRKALDSVTIFRVDIESMTGKACGY